jgi:hypothetical protein
MLKMPNIKSQPNENSHREHRGHREFPTQLIHLFSREQKQTDRDKSQSSLKRWGGNSIIGLVGALPVLGPARLTTNKS